MVLAKLIWDKTKICGAKIENLKNSHSF